MSKKAIAVVSTSIIAGGLTGYAVGTYMVRQVLTRSGMPMKSVPQMWDFLKKYEDLGYALSATAEQHNTSSETMLKFTNLMFDIIVNEHPEIMQDPRFQELYVNDQFEGITKNLKKEGDDGNNRSSS